MSKPAMRRVAPRIGFWWAVAACAAPAFAFEPVAVSVDNRTRPTTCAEEDNVSFALRAPRIDGFRVEALPPRYLDRIGSGITAPDFSGCNFDGGSHPTDPVFHFEEGRVVLHDGPRWRIVGLTLPRSWRPQRVPVTVGTRTVHGIHLLQVHAKTQGKPLEVLVMYPADGYWRIKPVPEPRFGDGVYGSSFLLGPVTHEGRPLVAIEDIRVETRPLVLHLRFAGGGHARVALREASRARTTLDVSFQPALIGGDAFAMLRSMYVERGNADVSEVTWRAGDGSSAAIVRALPEVDRFDATDVRFGRSAPSLHNTSAPDIRFSTFTAAPGR